MNRNGDKFDRWIVTSAVLHSLVFTLVIFSPTLFPMRGDANWGTNTTATAACVNRSLSGVSLPSPGVVTDSAAANDSEGLRTEEATPPPPAGDAYLCGNSARESHRKTETTARRASENQTQTHRLNRKCRQTPYPSDKAGDRRSPAVSSQRVPDRRVSASVTEHLVIATAGMSMRLRGGFLRTGFNRSSTSGFAVRPVFI